MIRKARRLLGVSALSLFVCLWMFGCSGQQEADEEVEASEQGEQGAEGQQAAEGQGNNLAANEGNNAAEGEGGAEPPAAEAAAGTENDLQEIIQEMNGQPAPNGAQAAPLAQNAVPQNPAPPATDLAAVPAASGPAPQGAAPIPFQPGGAPAGQGLPELGSKMAYIVEKGDTLGKISQKIFGSPGRWKELADLSGITNPSRIFPGDLVYYTLDEGAVGFAQAYEATSRSEEQVKPGDTLATIAKRVYGSTTAWRSIWRQNDRIDNPDIVPPGTTVYYLPHGSAVAAAEKIQHKVKNLNSKTAKTLKINTNKNQKVTYKPSTHQNNKIQTEISNQSNHLNLSNQSSHNTQLEAFSSKIQTTNSHLDQTFFESNHQLI